jgi:hypothetical protein
MAIVRQLARPLVLGAAVMQHWTRETNRGLNCKVSDLRPRFLRASLLLFRMGHKSTTGTKYRRFV